MSVARAFNVLNLYDVLVNLIPGSALILALGLIFHLDPYLNIQTGGMAVGIFLIASFIAGHIIQAVASKLAGTPTLFGEIVTASKEGQAEISSVTFTHIENQLWPLMQQKFDLPEDFEDKGALFRLLLSYIETTPATRALRFQSLHSFHRSMWATSIIIVAMVIIAGTLKLLGLSLVGSWIVLGIALIASFVAIYVFDNRREKFNKRFIQYAITDFYISQYNNREDSQRAD